MWPSCVLASHQSLWNEKYSSIYVQSSLLYQAYLISETWISVCEEIISAKRRGNLQKIVRCVITVPMRSIVVTENSREMEWSDRKFRHLKDFPMKAPAEMSKILPQTMAL